MANPVYSPATNPFSAGDDFPSTSTFATLPSGVVPVFCDYPHVAEIGFTNLIVTSWNNSEKRSAKAPAKRRFSLRFEQLTVEDGDVLWYHYMAQLGTLHAFTYYDYLSDEAFTVRYAKETISRESFVFGAERVGIELMEVDAVVQPSPEPESAPAYPASLQAWWRSIAGRWQDAGKTIAADDTGETLAVWTEIVNGYDWEDVGTAEPAYLDPGFGGQPSITFGTGTLLRCTDAALIDLFSGADTPHSIIVCYRTPFSISAGREVVRFLSTDEVTKHDIRSQSQSFICRRQGDTGAAVSAVSDNTTTPGLILPNRNYIRRCVFHGTSYSEWVTDLSAGTATVQVLDHEPLNATAATFDKLEAWFALGQAREAMFFDDEIDDVIAEPFEQLFGAPV